MSRRYPVLGGLGAESHKRRRRGAEKERERERTSAARTWFRAPLQTPTTPVRHGPGILQLPSVPLCPARETERGADAGGSVRLACNAPHPFSPLQLLEQAAAVGLLLLGAD